MCLIAYAKKDRSQIPAIHLSRAHARNSDAWGIMFPQNGRVQLLRDVSGYSAFEAAWKTVPSKTPCAAHFRFATAGARDATMAHPFPILEDASGVQLAVMHNGVLSCVSEEDDLSDTAVLIRDILQPQLVAMPSLIECEGWLKAMGAVIGQENKLLFLRGDGAEFFVNADQGERVKGGVWYSNTYSIEEPKYSSLKDWKGGYTFGDLLAKPSENALTIGTREDTWDDIATRTRREHWSETDVEPLPSLWEMSEQEIYTWVSENCADDITDAIMDLLGTR